MIKAGRVWVIVPAAGIGKRVGAKVPKQYLPLLGKTVLEHTLGCFINKPFVHRIIVPLHPEDKTFSHLSMASSSKIKLATGGNERFHSVYNALVAIKEDAKADDWVMVHDAVRPCLQDDDLYRLVDLCQTEAIGAILGVPVADTLKEINQSHQVLGTANRDKLWHALTPQMFRYKVLSESLQHVLDNNHFITDEAHAVELQGHRPTIVKGRRDNIKITHPEDLELVAFFLEKQCSAGKRVCHSKIV